MAFLFYKDIIKDMTVGFNNQLIENQNQRTMTTINIFSNLFAGNMLFLFHLNNRTCYKYHI